MSAADKSPSRMRSGSGDTGYATQRQADVKRCLTCGRAESRDEPFVAVLTPVRGQHHWMHAGACHDAYSAGCKTATSLPAGVAA